MVYRGVRGTLRCMGDAENMNDTIAALATPPLMGAIGVIRLSGGDAIEIAGKVISGKSGDALDSFPARQLCLGLVRDPSGDVLDEALAVVFPGPDSYTGDDVVELHCHGSPALLREVLRLLYAGGARPAQPGEFTRRAFLHGRMDLAQAEAVIDLISAETALAARNAAGQLGGALSRAIEEIWSSICDLCAHFQALVDYPEDDIPPLPTPDIIESLRRIGARLLGLASTYDRGKILREGVPCALIGKPNTGKSSLLNALLGYERAIVTAQPGTTRDTLVESLHMGGHWLRIADTAGLRNPSGDVAERMGIDRAREAARKAGLVLVVLDGSRSLDGKDGEALDMARGRATIVLLNKSDLPHHADVDIAAIEASFPEVCRVSALTGQGLDALDRMIGRVLDAGAGAGAGIHAGGTLLTNLRHAEAVTGAAEAVASAADALGAGFTADVVLTELESALSNLGEITGRDLSADIIDRVFSRFCVGK